MAAVNESKYDSIDHGIATESGVLRLPPLHLACGATLSAGELAWQCWGAHGAPVVIVLGGISAGRDIGAWWKEQCGERRALDPRELRLVSIDWLGGSDRSSGPRDDVAFPAIDSIDQANALLALLNHLSIAHVDAIVGASYGGCVGQHLAALLGSRLRTLVVIGSAHRAGPWALALRHLQRAGIEAAGDDADARRQALMRARQLAVLGYRTAAELERRFGETDPREGVLGWLQAHGERFANRFDPDSFLRLSASLDAHACAPESISVSTTVVAIDEDLIVPIALATEFTHRLGGRANLVTLRSEYGHDAFLKEPSAIADILRDALRAEVLA